MIMFFKFLFLKLNFSWLPLFDCLLFVDKAHSPLLLSPPFIGSKATPSFIQIIFHKLLNPIINNNMTYKFLIN